MAYATVADMVARFGDVEMIHASDRDDNHQINTSVIEGAINDASDFIDGHLAGRYALPLQTSPKMLTRICCDIARFYLDDSTVTEKQQNAFDTAKSVLSKLADGRMSLGLPVDSQPEQTDGDIEMQSAGSVFGRNQSKSFI